jgi:glycosyltransferase involved in cell wall biosynthesis
MSVWVFAICHNDIAILPWWLKHYSEFADKILVWDDDSTDGSKELLAASPRVELFRWPHNTGLDEDAILEFAISAYPMAQGKADWVIWADCDEFIYDPNILAVLEKEKADGIQLIQTAGFNMTGDGVPPFRGKRQLWEIRQQGVRSNIYAKPVVFDPARYVRWNRGKHAIVETNAKLSDGPKLKLLHYRYMGYSYTAFKNAKNYSRVGLLSGEKAHAWSCAPTYTGEHSPEWSEIAKGQSINAVEAPL